MARDSFALLEQLNKELEHVPETPAKDGVAQPYESAQDRESKPNAT